jgi:hypothetical protein
MNRLRFSSLTLLVCGLALACGSGGGTSDGGGAGAGGKTGGAGTDGGADAGVPDTTWKENGVLRTATYPSLVTRHKTATSDTLNVVAADIPAHATLSFAVGGAALTDGTYTCGADAGGPFVAVSYDNVMTTDESCSLTVTFTTDAAGKPRASGTFEAVVTIPAGTKTLTEGHFDLAVMPL